MRNYLILTCIWFITLNILADDSQVIRQQEELNRLLAIKTETIFTCQIPEMNGMGNGNWSVQVFKSEPHNQTYLAIQDYRVNFFLGLLDPDNYSYLGLVSEYILMPSQVPSSTKYVFPSVSGYIERSSGKFKQGVVLFSDGAGMKLATLNTRSEMTEINYNRNWYFNPGECIQGGEIVKKISCDNGVLDIQKKDRFYYTLQINDPNIISYLNKAGVFLHSNQYSIGNLSMAIFEGEAPDVRTGSITCPGGGGCGGTVNTRIIKIHPESNGYLLEVVEREYYGGRPGTQKDKGILANWSFQNCNVLVGDEDK